MYIRATSPDTSIRRRRDVGPTLPSRAWPAAGALYGQNAHARREATARDPKLSHATIRDTHCKLPGPVRPGRETEARRVMRIYTSCGSDGISS